MDRMICRDEYMRKSDWLVRHDNGQFEIYNPELFARHYEPS